MATVTVCPPGLIVSGSLMAASPSTVTVIVTLWPAWRVPDDCDRLTSASSCDGAEIDQVTGPPFAVSVNEPLRPTARAMWLLDTLSVPAVVAEDEAEAEADGEAVGVVADGEAAGLVADGEVPAVVGDGEADEPRQDPPLCDPEGDDDLEADPPDGDAVAVRPAGEEPPPETRMAELPAVGIEDGVAGGAGRCGCGATSLA